MVLGGPEAWQVAQEAANICCPFRATVVVGDVVVVPVTGTALTVKVKFNGPAAASSDTASVPSTRQTAPGAIVLCDWPSNLNVRTPMDADTVFVPAEIVSVTELVFFR